MCNVPMRTDLTNIDKDLNFNLTKHDKELNKWCSCPETGHNVMNMTRKHQGCNNKRDPQGK